MRATIKSIANDLGISHMTVSRALSGGKNVNAKTRQEIIDHAVKVGYVKNSAAIMMRGDSSAIIGLLVPNITNEFYAYFANSFGELCAKAGFDLVINLTNDDYELEVKSISRMQALQARAVIRVPSPRPSNYESNNSADLVIFDLIRASGEGYSAGALMIDDGASIQKAVSLLLEKGCEKIAYIGAVESLSSGRERFNAFEQALRKKGHKLHGEYIKFTATPNYQMGYSSMIELLEMPHPPEALICGGFEISNGALDACLKKMISIPDDLAFIGYGDPSFYQWITGGITTISLPIADIAKAALELAISAAKYENRPHIVLPTTLIIRGSI